MLIGFRFFEDENLDILNKEVTTVWDVLGDLGGFLEIVEIISIFLMFHYSNFNFS